MNAVKRNKIKRRLRSIVNDAVKKISINLGLSVKTPFAYVSGFIKIARTLKDRDTDTDIDLDLDMNTRTETRTDRQTNTHTCTCARAHTHKDISCP